MTDSEGTKLEVSFYTVSPFNSKLATINVDKALAVGETTDVTIPFTFFENAAYRFIVKVDENQEISEGPGGPELNNEGVKNVYAESSVDAFVSNMTVDLGDGLAGKECPMVFEVGIANIPQGTTYRLFFNVTVDGTFGWSEVLSLANQNSTGFYPLGTGYSVIGQDAFIDFNCMNIYLFWILFLALWAIVPLMIIKGRVDEEPKIQTSPKVKEKKKGWFN